MKEENGAVIFTLTQEHLFFLCFAPRREGQRDAAWGAAFDEIFENVKGG